MCIRTAAACPRRTARLWLAGAALMLAAGCQSALSVLSMQQQVFQNWTPFPDNPTYEFDHPERYDLEGQTYLSMLRREIGYTGLTPAEPGKPAGFVVSLDYAAVPQQAVVQDDDPWDPYFFGGYGWGPWGPRYYSPWYGGLYFRGPSRVRTVSYNRYAVRVDIHRKSPPAQVYQSTVTADSDSLTLPQAMPYLLKGVFGGFPGQNGQVRQFRLPVQP